MLNELHEQYSAELNIAETPNAKDETTGISEPQICAISEPSRTSVNSRRKSGRLSMKNTETDQKEVDQPKSDSGKPSKESNVSGI